MRLPVAFIEGGINFNIFSISVLPEAALKKFRWMSQMVILLQKDVESIFKVHPL